MENEWIKVSQCTRKFYFEISVVWDNRSGTVNKNRKYDKTIFFDLRGFFEVSVYRILRDWGLTVVEIVLEMKLKSMKLFYMLLNFMHVFVLKLSFALWNYMCVNPFAWLLHVWYQKNTNIRAVEIEGYIRWFIKLEIIVLFLHKNTCFGISWQLPQ